MVGKLQEELKQSKPFVNLESEAYLNLLVLVQMLTDGVCQLLKSTALSMPQYNVLRILRGAGKTGRSCSEIADRLIHRVPDVTRLLDRLESRGLVIRQREARDRRIVRCWISDEGLHLIDPLDAPMAEFHEDRLGHLGNEKLKQLIQLVEEARSGANNES